MGAPDFTLTALRGLRTIIVGLVIVLGAGSVAQAQSYQAGLDEVDAGSIDRAVEIWQDIIDRDAPDRARAEYALALLYETGRAVPWDEARAAELYAASGLPEALTNLGLMYAEGRGVRFDPSRAAELWQQAADVGHAFAQFNLGLAFYGGNGVPKNAVRALELIYEAGEGGLPEAQWAVCQFYERGVGVPVDLDRAIHWCALAAEQGQLQAVDAVQRLSAQQRGTSSPAVVPEMPENDPDNVDLSAEVPAALVETDPANEFVTQPPPEPAAQLNQPEAVASGAPDADRRDGGPEPQDSAADPLMLLGSEFDEFADLFAPVDPGDSDNPVTTPKESAQSESDSDTELASSSRVRTGDLLSDASDEIASLIESAGPIVPELPDLNIDEAPTPDETMQAPGLSLSLQEMVDGSLATTRLASDPANAPEPTVPPLPTNRPAVTYEIPPVIDGPVYAVWLGTGQDAEEASAIYNDAMDAAPDILGIMEAAFQNDVLTRDQTGFARDVSVVRLLFGPLPGEDYAWQICNLLRLKQRSTFCFPVEVEG